METGKTAEVVPTGYQLRRCRSREDLLNLDRIALSAEFHMGLHNWELFFDTSPDSVFFVTTSEGKIVGFITCNRALPNFIYRHQILMLPEYRSGNFMRKFFQLEEESNMPSGFNANYISLQKIFVDRPYIVDYKQLGYEGFVNGSVPDPTVCGYTFDGHIDLLTEANLESLLDYDRQLYSSIGPCPKRQEFMRKYAADTVHSKTLVVTNNSGVTVGYGVMRIIDDGYCRLSPVYADCPAVGFQLLCALVKQIPPQMIFYLAFPATNLASLRFCHQMKLKWEYSEFRVYEKSVLNLPIAKMFAEQEFWPL